MSERTTMAKASPTVGSRQLAGWWTVDEVEDAQRWAAGFRERPTEALNPQQLGLSLGKVNDERWRDGLRTFRRSAQERGVTQTTLPSFVWDGLCNLNLVQSEPRLAEVDGALWARTSMNLLLVPEMPNWDLGMRCLAQGRVPVVPFLGMVDSAGRVDPSDLRTAVCGYLPLIMGDMELAKFVKAIASTASRTSSPLGRAFLKTLWHATMVEGVVQVGNAFKPYGARLVTDRPSWEWACNNASTKRTPLTVDAIRRAPLRELQNRSEKAEIFVANGPGHPLKILHEWIRAS